MWRSGQTCTKNRVTVTLLGVGVLDRKLKGHTVRPKKKKKNPRPQKLVAFLSLLRTQTQLLSLPNSLTHMAVSLWPIWYYPLKPILNPTKYHRRPRECKSNWILNPNHCLWSLHPFDPWSSSEFTVMSNSGGFALTRTHGSDRFYNPPAVRRHQQLLLQQQQQRQLRKTVKSENRVESGEPETRTDSDESTLSRPSSACSSSSPRQADLTNLDRVMESVTPSVPAQLFSEVVYSFMGLFVCR